MRGSEAFNLPPEERISERSMQPQPAKIESDIADIKLGMREFRMDLQAANESISDLRASVATVEGKVETLHATMDSKMGALSDRVDAKLAAMLSAILLKLDENMSGIRKEMGEMRKEMSNTRKEMGDMSDRISEDGAMLKAILWTLGIGLVGAIGKAFNWI